MFETTPPFKSILNAKLERGAYRGRLAPTPSGYLHAGHARTFGIAHSRARDARGTLVLRIEDVDKLRCKELYVKAAVEDLRWAGLTWDEGPDVGGEHGPYFQSKRSKLYLEALKYLISKDLVYPCFKSRSQVRAASALAEPWEVAGLEPEVLYPAAFRPDLPCAAAPETALKNPQHFNWRFKAQDGANVEFDDLNYGAQSFEAGKHFGDFLVWRKEGCASYELAVVADDIAMGISEVVRGADLLLSTARQVLIYKAFNAELPAFFHCPLILGADGKKLSKSAHRVNRGDFFKE